MPSGKTRFGDNAREVLALVHKLLPYMWDGPMYAVQADFADDESFVLRPFGPAARIRPKLCVYKDCEYGWIFSEIR